MKRKFLFLAGAAVAAAVVLLLTLGDAGRTPETLADTATAGFDIVMCDGTGGDNDPTYCTKTGTSIAIGDPDGIIQVGENPEVITVLSIGTEGTEQPFFDMSSTTYTGLGAGDGAATTDGVIVGEIHFAIQSNLVVPTKANVNWETGQPYIIEDEGTGTPTEMTDTFILYDADLGTATDEDPFGIGAGLIPTTDSDDDGHVDTQEDNLSADGSAGANGIFDGVDLMPESLVTVILPAIQEAIGDKPLISRAFGVAQVATISTTEVNQDVNFLVFDMGGGTYLSLTTIAYPGGPGAETKDAADVLRQSVLTSPPFLTIVRIYGVSQDNTESCYQSADFPAKYYRGCSDEDVPNITGGDINRTASAGEQYYGTFVTTIDNYDGDMAGGDFDTCHADVSIDTDLIAHVEGETTDGKDRWDSSCDSAPLTWDNDSSGGDDPTYTLPDVIADTWALDDENCNQPYITSGSGWDCDQDVDGDTTLNTVDNCPNTADADVDEDGMEDGSGPVAPGTGDCNDGIDNLDADVFADMDDPDCWPFVDWQQDSDTDGVGDVCDPEPNIKGNGDGYFIDAHPHGLLASDPPGGAGYYHDHDSLCEDPFTIPATEASGDALDCVNIVDTSDDGSADWQDVNGNGVYEIGEPISTGTDMDGDGHSDACEALGPDGAQNTGDEGDPLDPDSVPTGPPPAGNCDGDDMSDEDEEAAGRDPFEHGTGATPTPTTIPTVTPTPTMTPTPIPGECILPFTEIRANDKDCDGAPDADEDEVFGPTTTCGSRDKTNRWDFYDVPAPTIHNGGNMTDQRDSAVSINNDVLGVLEYNGTSDGGPCNSGPDGIGGNEDDRCYNDDKDADTVPDGVAYDRSAAGAWPEAGEGKTRSGAADGAININTDILLAQDQNGHGC